MPTRLAIAAEGQTDQRVIDNILTGFFSDRDAPVEIRWDRPQHDEPGGWLRLLNYLRDKEYRAAFQFNDYLVVQIDTDRSFDAGFDVPHTLNGRALTVEELSIAVRARLEAIIGYEDLQAYEGRFLFAVCVHSVECWLLPLYGRAYEVSEIRNCKYRVDAGLRRQNRPRLNKNDVATYANASAQYRRRRTLLRDGTKQASLSIFLASLTDVAAI
jgi:hypothetical protein